MGFKREVTTRDGLTHANAYHKVSGVRINHHGNRATVSLIIWEDQNARNGEKGPLTNVIGKQQFTARKEDYTTWFSPTAMDAADKNPVKQAYLYAKNQINDPAIVDIDPD